MDGGFVMYKKGLRKMHDIWDPERKDLLSSEETRVKFSIGLLV